MGRLMDHPAHSNGLVISFYRDGERPRHVYCQTGDRAWQHAVHLLATRVALQPGDMVICRRADEPIVDEPPTVPEAQALLASSAIAADISPYKAPAAPGGALPLIPARLVEGIDAWAAQQDDKPLRSEAIRRMVEIVLKGKRT